MSAETSAWAIRVKIPNAPTKNLLMIVADLANHVTGEVYPSLAYLQEATGLTKKTVLAVLKKLVDLQILEATEERKGKTGQIPVYLFHMVEGLPMISKPSGIKRGVKTHPLPNGDGKEASFRPETGVISPEKQASFYPSEPSIRNQVEERDSNHYADPAAETDLFGEPVVSPEEQLAALKAQAIEAIRTGWNDLAAEVPGVAALRGGKLDDARAEAGWQRGEKYAAEGEYATDVWAAIFRQIRSSRWLCGETTPRGGRSPFRLQLTWLLEHRNFTKVLEGKFADDRDPDLSGTAQSRRSPAGQALDIVLQRRRTRRQRRDEGGGQRGAASG